MNTAKKVALGVRQLQAIARFRDSLVHIQCDASLSAQRKGTKIISLHQQNLAQFQTLGLLTPEVEKQLTETTDSILALVEDLSGEHAAALMELGAGYQPPRSAHRLRQSLPAPVHHAPLTPGERLSYWWKTTALPALRKDDDL